MADIFITLKTVIRSTSKLGKTHSMSVDFLVLSNHVSIKLFKIIFVGKYSFFVSDCWHSFPYCKEKFWAFGEFVTFSNLFRRSESQTRVQPHLPMSSVGDIKINFEINTM